MTTKSVLVDYGERKIEIHVPSSAAIVEFKEPPLLADPQASIRNALAAPLDSAPLAKLARPGMRVAIGFDDGTRPNIPPQTILPIVVEELVRAGVRERDIVFICATAHHRKPRSSELATHLGPELYNRFYRYGQIINHDCYDPEQLQFLGITDGGHYVEHNRRFLNADLMIYQGNVAATHWRSFTGTGVVIGLASTKSIASNHSYRTVRDPAAKKKEIGTKTKTVSVKDQMSAFMQLVTGKSVFYINAVNGSGGRMAGVFAGSAQGVKPPAWEMAERYFTQEAPQADVLITGLPQAYPYGSPNNTLIAAVGALVTPRFSSNAPLLREGGVVIVLSTSNGQIDRKMYPSYQDAIDLYARLHSTRALVDYEEEFDNNPEYRWQYTHGHGFAPLHPFWLMYENEYTLSRAGSVIMVGTSHPGAFRALGFATAPDFDTAWKMTKKYVGSNPRTVVAPTFSSKPRFKFAVEAE